MKRSILLSIVLAAVITLTAYSQISNGKTVSSPDEQTYIFCELIQQEIILLQETRTTIFLAFGSKSTYQYQADERNYVRLQKEGLNALNYMGERGWELASKTVREFSTNGVESIYLLRKKIR